MSLSVRENIVALVLDALSRLGFVSPRRESSLVASSPLVRSTATRWCSPSVTTTSLGRPGRWTTAPATGPPTRGAMRARSVTSPLPKSWTESRPSGASRPSAAAPVISAGTRWPRYLSTSGSTSKHGPPADGQQYFICGPTSFVENAARLLVDQGVADRQIRTERFGPSGGTP